MSVQRTHVIAPAVASAAAVHAAITLTTVPQTVTTGITNPVVCRVLSITGNAAGIAGNVTLVGTDANGDAASDTVALNGTATVLGTVAFTTVTSIGLPARTAAGNTVSIGIGDVFGLPGHIALTSDVTQAERMATGLTVYTAEAVGAVDADNGTVAAVIVAGDTMRWTYYDRGVSGDLIDELRQMVAEPDSTTFSDDDLAIVIARFALIDADEYEPDDTDWTPTYDLNAAAANIWSKKASALAALYDFAADGGNYRRSQAYQHAKAEARRYASMRAPQSLRIHVDHHFERDLQSTYWDQEARVSDDYVVNRAEDEDE